MNPSKQTGQLFILLLLTISIYALFYDNSAQKNGPTSKTLGQEKPAAYIKGGEFLIFNKEGKVSSKLHSNEAFYYNKSNRIAIQSPQVTLKASQGQIIKLTAKEGVHFLDEKRIKMLGDVKVVQNTPVSEGWQLATQELELNNQARFISTDQAVTIRKGINLIQAVGLKAWLDEKKLDLISDVRGRYVYQQTSP